MKTEINEKPLPALRCVTEDEVIRELVHLQSKEDILLHMLEGTSISLGEGPNSLLGNYRYLNIAADIVGIPKEPEASYEQMCNDENFYCRDWIMDYFDEMVTEKHDIAGFIEELRKEGATWKAKSNQ